MKRILLVTLLIVMASSATYSNYSMLTCTAERGTSIQVYLNGKLINKQPSEVVRLKSNDGCHSISVMVHNTSQNQSFVVQRDIYIEPGYEVFFKVSYDECEPKLTVAGRYPLLNTYSYSKKLYARQLIS